MPPTKSSLAAEARAVFGKEWRSEVRMRHGLFTAGLFSLLAVAATSFASHEQKPGGTLAAGIFCVTLLFAAVSSLPRTFLLEDEQGTFELLRLLCRPASAFVGKTAYNLLQTIATSGLLAVLYTTLTGVEVANLPLLVAGLAVECVALAAAVSICGTLVMGASNRWLLASAVALPLLLPQMALAVGALRGAFGEGFVGPAWQNVLGLAGFAVALLALGPVLAEAVWKRDGE